ncbi:MAG: hypothetical protein J2P37_17075, partial [Ktedonobacteraceae bacterium]|nr:hypothetical protein [Ktedonobacteraceae bacterium]
MTTREKAKERLDYRQTEEIPAIESRKALLAWGGVGPDRGVSAAHNLETITNPPGRPPAVGAFSDFTYHGGPVVAYPQVYVSFWGALWTGDEVYKTRAQRLTRFHQDLLKSDFMNVLSQYGVGTGAGSGVFVQSSFLTDVPVTLNEQLVRNTIQSCINSKVLPEPPDPSNNILVIYLDETVSVKDLDHDLVLCESGEDAAFGYHSFFRTEAGNPCYYAVIPALTDQDVQNACRGKDGSLYISAQQEQRLTQVASHTFAELTTDPELNAWFDPKYGESGDICNGEPDVITLGANQWVVQRIYSKFDDVQTGGATYSLSQAASSRALLSPGPVARPTMIPGMQHIPSYDRLLPFPSMYVDGANEEVSMDAQELHNYVMGMFHPLRAEHIIADLPRMLRAVTSVLETEEERNTRHIVGGSALSREEQQDAAFNLSLQHADLPRMLREVAA